MVKLRPYQQEAVESVFKHWENRKSALLVQATGTGKTIVFSEIAKRIVEHGGRVLILAHRDELINQAKDKLSWAQGIVAGVEKAEKHAKDEKIVIASVQTLGNTKRLNQFVSNYFTHIIIDEAHHSIASQYQKILEHFKDAKLLGVTATPYRGDRKDLSSIFDSIVYEYSLPEAINDDYLSPILTKQIPLKIDLNDVHQSMGDFKASELDTALDSYLEQIADIMSRECQGRKTVVFLPLISTSERFAKTLRDKGLNTLQINGKSSNRGEILNEFENGNVDVLCNSMLLTEGWDCPRVDCIVNLRPTRSEALYVQIIGRGTRKAENKENLLILDFLWQSERFDLCRPSVLVAGNKEQEKKLNEYIDSGKEIDLKEALEEAKKDVIKEREATLAKELASKRKRKGNLIDPIQFGLSIEAEDLIDYEPQFAWERGPVSEKQLRLLKSKDVDVSSIPNAGYASKLIDRLIMRDKLKLSTPKQIRCLERKGFKKVGLWTKAEACRMIGIIEKNNWRTPFYINPENYNPKKEAKL